jgi:hypothetical protein
MNQHVPIKLQSGGEVTAEADLPTIVAALGRDLQASVKGMDDIVVELDVVQDPTMGARAKLRFRSYRRVPT